MATAGDKISVGPGMWCISDSAAADIAEWDAEASGTIVEVISVVASTQSATNAPWTFSIQDAANGHLIQAVPLHISKSLLLTYPAGNFPRLNGLTVDSPTAGTPATTPLAYTILYRKLK